MIDTIKELESELSVAKGNSTGVPTLKSVVNTDGKESFTIIPSSRYSKHEKVDVEIAKEFLEKNMANLTEIRYNKQSTTLYIRIK